MYAARTRGGIYEGVLTEVSLFTLVYNPNTMLKGVHAGVIQERPGSCMSQVDTVHQVLCRMISHCVCKP
jgi:hypothetical protein